MGEVIVDEWHDWEMRTIIWSEETENILVVAGRGRQGSFATFNIFIVRSFRYPWLYFIEFAVVIMYGHTKTFPCPCPPPLTSNYIRKRLGFL